MPPVFGDKGSPERLRLLSHIRSGKCAAQVSGDVLAGRFFCHRPARGEDIFCCEHRDSDPGLVDYWREHWREEHERAEKAVAAANDQSSAFYEEGYEHGLAEAGRLAREMAYEIASHRRMVTEEMRREVIRRDGRRCARCGSTSAVFHIDHIVPFALGGACAVDNLQVLCETCNLAKGARFADYRPVEVADPAIR